MANALSSKISFLSKNDERFLIWIPWIGTALALLLWGGRHAGIPGLNRVGLIDMMVGLIFLDGVHITYTFILLLSLPELKVWSGNQKLWRKTAIVALLLIPLFYFIRLSSYSLSVPLIITCFYFIEALAPSQHTLAQMRGISFCFHSALRKSTELTAEEMQVAAQVERREKKLFQLLLFADIFTAIPNIMIQGELALPHPTLFPLLRNIGAVVIVATAIALLFNAYRYPRQKQTKKMSFLSRVLLFPLRLFIRPTGLVIRICHGTEYLVVLRQMVKNSKTTASKKSRVLQTTFWVSMAYAGVYILTNQKVLFNVGHWEEPRSVFAAALMLHLTVRYVHYYVDRALYRMKDAQTRSTVGPMLVSMPPQASLSTELAA